MATDIANIIIPEQFSKYVLAETAEKSAFIQSGIIRQDGALNALITAGGQTITMPTWSDLSGDANVSGKDNSTTATAQTFSINKEISAILRRNGAWEATDLVASLAGSDPIKFSS